MTEEEIHVLKRLKTAFREKDLDPLTTDKATRYDVQRLEKTIAAAGILIASRIDALDKTPVLGNRGFLEDDLQPTLGSRPPL